MLRGFVKSFSIPKPLAALALGERALTADGDSSASRCLTNRTPSRKPEKLCIDTPPWYRHGQLGAVAAGRFLCARYSTGGLRVGRGGLVVVEDVDSEKSRDSPETFRVDRMDRRISCGPLAVPPFLCVAHVSVHTLVL